jgi:Ca2+-binding RTX toxin-like protein
VTVNLATQTASGGHAAGDVLFDIENIIGTALNDNLTGDNGDNVLRGGDGGTDWLSGGGGSDTASYAGGAAVGVSLLHGSIQNTGGQGWDLLNSIENLVGSSFDDWLTGEYGANVLDGGAGADHLNGFDGNDRFVQRTAADGVDIISGGAGFDTIDYSTAAAGVNVQFLGWSATSGGALLTTFTGIEAAIGSAFDDALIGDGADNRLTGGAGSDWLVGQGGDDWFVPGTQNGVDRLFGDAGVDTIDYSAAGVGVTVQLTGWATTSAGALLSTFTGLENAVGSAFSDALIGTAADNRITGGAGADWLVGGDGNDTFVQTIDTGGIDRLFGGAAGADAGAADTIDYSGASAGVVVQLSGYATVNQAGGATLAVFAGIENAAGTAFSDALIGNAADNRLTGGAGGDWLVGGGGADTFVYAGIGDGAGDSIRDFTQTQDRIDLSAIDANPLAPGNDAFTFSDARTPNAFGEVVVTNFGGYSLVSLYLDYDSNVDVTIQVVHAPGVVMNAGDFVL